MDRMNQQLSAHDYQWELNQNPATQASLPLKLVPNPVMQ